MTVRGVERLKELSERWEAHPERWQLDADYFAAFVMPDLPLLLAVYDAAAEWLRADRAWACAFDAEAADAAEAAVAALAAAVAAVKEGEAS